MNIFFPLCCWPFQVDPLHYHEAFWAYQWIFPSFNIILNFLAILSDFKSFPYHFIWTPYLWMTCSFECLFSDTCLWILQEVVFRNNTLFLAHPDVVYCFVFLRFGLGLYFICFSAFSNKRISDSTSRVCLDGETTFFQHIFQQWFWITFLNIKLMGETIPTYVPHM